MSRLRSPLSSSKQNTASIINSETTPPSSPVRPSQASSAQGTRTFSGQTHNAGILKSLTLSQGSASDLLFEIASDPQSISVTTTSQMPSRVESLEKPSSTSGPGLETPFSATSALSTPPLNVISSAHALQTSIVAVIPQIQSYIDDPIHKVEGATKAIKNVLPIAKVFKIYKINCTPA